MAYTNLPPNLYDYFSTINQRIRKLESAPDQAMTTAASAQSTANAAYAQAINASIQATNAAYTAGVAYSSASGKNTTNYASYAPSPSSNNTNGTVPITGDLWFVVNPSTGYASDVYTYKSGSWGHSPLDGSSNVILNIDAGKLVAGTIIANVAISNGSGTFYVDRYGNLSATSASIQGTITATSGSFTGSLYSSNGTIGNFNINSYGFTSTSSAVQLLASGLISTSGQVQANSINVNGASTVPSGGIGVYGGGWFGSTIYANSLGTTTSGLPVYQVQSGASAGYLKAYTSAQRFKTNITPISVTGYASIIDEMTPVTYDDIEDETQKDIPGLIAEELAKVKGMEGLVVYDQTGQTMGINYEKLGVMIILALKELNIQSRLTALEGKVNGFGTSS
jgi:hypothetical protein